MTILKDHYIRALEYGESHREFTIQDLAEEIGLTAEQIDHLALQVHQKQIFNQDANSYYANYKENHIKLHFSVEDKFRLLNYIALQEARASSKSATRFAGAALLVSVLSLLFSATISYMQLTSTINIPPVLMDKIDRLLESQTKTNQVIYSSSGKTQSSKPENEKTIPEK